jgi:hypothetical protein
LPPLAPTGQDHGQTQHDQRTDNQSSTFQAIKEFVSNTTCSFVTRCDLD